MLALLILLAPLQSAPPVSSPPSTWHAAAIQGNLALALELARKDASTHDREWLIALLETEISPTPAVAGDPRTSARSQAELLGIAWEIWGTEALLIEGPQSSVDGARVALQLAAKHNASRSQESLLTLADAVVTSQAGSRAEAVIAAARQLGWQVTDGKSLEVAAAKYVLAMPGRYRQLKPLMVPPEVELLLMGGVQLHAAKPEAGVIASGQIRCLTRPEDCIELTGRKGWAGWELHGRRAQLLRHLSIEDATCGLNVIEGNLFAEDLLVKGCERGVFSASANLVLTESRFEKCKEFGVSTNTNGGSYSELLHCEFDGNGVGAQTTFRQHLFLTNCLFRRNETPAALTFTDARLTAQGCNFEGKGPVRILAGVSADLRNNWWGTPKPRIARIINPSDGTAAYFEPYLRARSDTAGRSAATGD